MATSTMTMLTPNGAFRVTTTVTPLDRAADDDYWDGRDDDLNSPWAPLGAIAETDEYDDGDAWRNIIIDDVNADAVAPIGMTEAAAHRQLRT